MSGRGGPNHNSRNFDDRRGNGPPPIHSYPAQQGQRYPDQFRRDRGPPGLDRGPGDRGPGDRGPGDRGPGDRGPGDRGPGDRGRDRGPPPYHGGHPYPPPHYADRFGSQPPPALSSRERGEGGGGRLPRDPPPFQQQPPPPPRQHPGGIAFRSYEEEVEWVEERRRKRKDRPTRFDILPSEASTIMLQQQLQPNAVVPTVINGGKFVVSVPGNSGMNTTSHGSMIPTLAAGSSLMMASDSATVLQQTRHARRLYVGNLPLGITEDQIHQAFRSAIRQALVIDSITGGGVNNDEDPIINVYINHERRFCFVEFKTLEMTTACMALDGLEVQGQAVKVKRPNDYNASTAPKLQHGPVPNLDVSRLGIISSNVLDGPNKIFIGGLHYHLADKHVLELLQAFGKVKAFHLVKNDPESDTSKGYCFVEYADPAVTPVAVQGLNGMDIGGGKSLTARLAGDRQGDVSIMAPGVAATFASAIPAPGSVLGTALANVVAAGAITPAASMPSSVANQPGQPPATHTIVAGYDVETMVDAAVGQGTMPARPVYFDHFGQPLTRIVPVIFIPLTATILPPPPPPPPSIGNVLSSQAMNSQISDILASLTAPPPPPPPVVASGADKTRVLVLQNMVTDDDLKTDGDYQALLDEIREECAKFGRLAKIVIPRNGQYEQASAVRKVFLHYESIEEAAKAQEQLEGRQFGDSTVRTSYFSEEDFAQDKLY